MLTLQCLYLGTVCSLLSALLRGDICVLRNEH